jgi:hypothetical protein
MILELQTGIGGTELGTTAGGSPLTRADHRL